MDHLIGSMARRPARKGPDRRRFGAPPRAITRPVGRIVVRYVQYRRRAGMLEADTKISLPGALNLS
jgi:hypothetical protein